MELEYHSDKLAAYMGTDQIISDVSVNAGLSMMKHKKINAAMDAARLCETERCSHIHGTNRTDISIPLLILILTGRIVIYDSQLIIDNRFPADRSAEALREYFR